jgi:hypothetical protein
LLDGGKHSGFLKNNIGRPTDELKRGVAKLEKQISMHEDKIANPAKYIEDWVKLDIRQQEALLKKKWPADINRQTEQRDILRSILAERESGQ